MNTIPGEKHTPRPKIDTTSYNVQTLKFRPISLSIRALGERIAIITVISPALTLPARQSTERSLTAREPHPDQALLALAQNRDFVVVKAEFKGDGIIGADGRRFVGGLAHAGEAHFAAVADDFQAGPFVVIAPAGGEA